MLTKNNSPAGHVEFDTKILIFTDEMLGDILDSQSNIDRLEAGKFKLVFWSVYTMEREVISVGRIQEAIGREKDTDLIDTHFLKDVKEAKVNYFQYMQKEWKLMKDSIQQDPRLHLIQDISEMKSDKINVFPSLEGAHAFITSVDEDNYMEVGVLERLETFIKNEPLSFITLTHFTDKKLFTHCFALKLVQKKELTNSNFYPQHLSKKGYSDMGEKFMEICIKANKGIDIKHVSLLGRLNIYEHIKANHQNFTRVMCSHAGITGVSYKDFLKNDLIAVEEDSRVHKNKIFENRGGYIVKLMFKRKNGPLKKRFNPQLINLFDEDIEQIIKIGGIIGISMDQRILGASTALSRIEQMLNYNSDYLTLEEFINLCQRANIRPESYLGENYMDKLDESLISIDDLEDTSEDTTRDALEWKKAHRKRLAQTILHILNVGKKVSDTPWNHIALGSDYDGLVDSLNCCKTSADVPKLKEDLIDLFTKLKRKQDYRFAISPEDLIKKIFEENAIDFYKR